MLMRTSRRDVLRLGAALAVPALARYAWADTWPNRPLRAVIPFSAGSTVDIIGRIAMAPLSAALGQRIVIENRAAAQAAPSAPLPSRTQNRMATRC
jgi:tripartite-type tricarboxylate transporter receptor subunit TctC